ncbi:thioredoxin-like protein [Clohesyomyces aquaticus]|uniref:Thioredoxin-like protein n=1 Tax=Clohesyomyces aquaticus TaxID=1231657 RepID=A0A1Y1ZFI3_9PLEO|nr:thioredoxin-like protein [Clohesyomyces aquaticus]
MPYESTISFTLDTICPWTYIAYLRFSRALSTYRTQSSPSPRVTFTLKILPYQLYPNASSEGVDRYQWYLDEKYNGSKEKMEMYVGYMRSLGKAEGMSVEFGEGEEKERGVMANTLNAHRVIWCVQERRGEEGVRACLESLYASYFSQHAHPSSPSTLLKACLASGLSEQEAKSIVEDESEGAMETKMLMREQAGNGVDSVPYVVFEGRRRDFTAVGAKEEGEYEKFLGMVEKEA